MTREEAIQYLNKLYTRAELTDVYGDMENMTPYEEALDMAIQALEQEPCSDAQERYEDLCEYFGDAKDILKNRKDFKAWLERIKWHIHKAEELYEKYENEKEPGGDAVSRQMVINSIANTNFWLSSDNWNELMKAINAIPSVNPKEPKTGEWEIIYETDLISEYKCSNCNNTFMTEGTNSPALRKLLYKPHLPNFCPNCGADMRGDAESEDD